MFIFSAVLDDFTDLRHRLSRRVSFRRRLVFYNGELGLPGDCERKKEKELEKVFAGLAEEEFCQADKKPRLSRQLGELAKSLGLPPVVSAFLKGSYPEQLDYWKEINRSELLRAGPGRPRIAFSP